MSKEIKKELLAGIVFPTIVGVILLLLEPTRNFLIVIFKYVIGFFVYLFKKIFGYLFSNHEINGLFFIFLIVLSVTFLVFVFAFLIELLKGKAYKDYNEDSFYGLKWRWRWGHTGIENLWCFCPICDFELTYDDSTTHRYSYDRNPRTDFICDHCQRIVGSIPKQDKDYILGIIEREIKRKIRNNLHNKKKEDA